ncbi:hypothetical protein [Enemella evansiae]|uniref:hypothetical protein n=1 Tax=Enemella evansiae TaxID=2016499 RepID=UPI000B969E6C|nr:hypothetical protein [Enemella evansiae]OYO02041.1 GNAT family N-acetyltransferase [Enemella evansiae]OYO03332.1 GNAT family N-acetyltransferase [Enemella evansiae]OYO13099.1 GNAT family N-acetyltransferase [Enemella evansiae]OYO15871.1 GNAT family N-acetyltransferase [Enemella evansiae]TDO94319.1 hypothetical protein C8D81_0091 [Enemella evansiae]
MTGARIRQASEADAPLVAALVIQAARAEGLEPGQGFMDRFVDAWREYRDQHPAWWAELDNQHAGLLLTARIRPLPWPGRTGGGELRAERLFVPDAYADRGVADALRAAARDWATARGMDWYDLADLSDR